jgi:hypothetical protein
MADNVMTVQQYLSGKVRNITVSDDAVATIIMDAGVAPKEVEKVVPDEGDSSGEGGTHTETVLEPVTKDTDITLLTTRERELCLAWLYVWVSGSPTQTSSHTEEDADWKHTEGGERMSANVLKQYLDMANEIFDKYDLPTVGEEKWGFVGRGICNPRYNRPV